jgi:short-subunit dehydrogenase
MSNENWALITGASAGLGAEFARQLAAENCNLLLVARRVKPMQELGERLSAEHGVRFETLSADLSNPSAPEYIANHCAANGLEVSFLVNNAGCEPPDLLMNREWKAHRAYLDLMMTSVAALCHFFIPAMLERGFGRVVNVASVAGLITAPGDYSYGPTKAYLVALSKSMTATIGGRGVNVMALCPGFTHTDFHQSPALTRMKRGMPAWLWYDADVVVREGLEALEKGKSVCISGRLYRWVLPLVRSRLGRYLLEKHGVRKPRAG